MHLTFGMHCAVLATFQTLFSLHVHIPRHVCIYLKKLTSKLLYLSVILPYLYCDAISSDLGTKLVQQCFGNADIVSIQWTQFMIRGLNSRPSAAVANDLASVDITDCYIRGSTWYLSP